MKTLASLPLAPLEATIAYCAEPVAALGGRVPIAGWVKGVVDNLVVLKPFVPVFLDVLGPTDANFYLDLCQHRAGWVAALAAMPQTLVHGDVRRANIAVLDADTVSLFDWELASPAPAATDLTWYWFLNFWCYPPNDGLHVSDRNPLRHFHVERMVELLGSRFDRETFDRSWDLGWLKVFAQLGFCLIDPLVGNPNAEDVARVRRTVQCAVGEAKRILDVHVR